MAAAPQGGGGQGGDDSFAILWWVTAFFALVLGIWYLFQDQLIHFFLTIKHYEVSLLKWFSNARWEHISFRIDNALSRAVPLPLKELWTITQTISRIYSFIAGGILLVLAFVVYYSNTTRQFKNIYSMESLADLEKSNWPQISPVLGLNLVKEDIDKGPWAMAMTPIQFCKKYKLIEEHRIAERTGHRRVQVTAVLKKGETNRIFALQLGALWQSADALPMHIRAVFAILAARINADSKSALPLVMQLSGSARTGLKFDGVNELLAKHLNTTLVQQITESHAYVMTVMYGMLETSRIDGVQASADFLWVKPLDRLFWYTLNTVGRQTPFAEVAGIHAHYVAEKTAGVKLFVPMVEEATRALEIALKEVVYRPDEDQ